MSESDTPKFVIDEGVIEEIVSQVNKASPDEFMRKSLQIIDNTLSCMDLLFTNLKVLEITLRDTSKGDITSQETFSSSYTALLRIKTDLKIMVEGLDSYYSQVQRNRSVDTLRRRATESMI